MHLRHTQAGCGVRTTLCSCCRPENQGPKEELGGGGGGGGRGDKCLTPGDALHANPKAGVKLLRMSESLKSYSEASAGEGGREGRGREPRIWLTELLGDGRILQHSFYLLLLRFLLLGGGTDIGEVGNNLLRVLCLSCTGLTAALEQRDYVSQAETRHKLE